MLVQPVRHPFSMLLREPEIPGARLLDSSTDVWAINRAAALDNFPINGLKVYVPAWSSMGKGDKVELQFDDQVVNQHIITDDAEVGQRVTLWVEPRHWLTGAHTLAYRVTRFNQGAETFTPALKLYAKLEIPAGQDTDDTPGSHSNLYLFIDPAIVENIVDKEIAAAGVDIIIRAESGTGVPYPDAAVGDVMVLSWGGVLVESAPLTAEQISDPATHPIVIHVDEATILDAGDTDISGLAVTFRVRDVVHNYSQDWCKATRLVVMTGVDFLDAPVVQEAVNNVLDLDALGEDDITGEVWAKGPAFEQDDRIILKMRGTTVDNEAVEVIAPAQTVDNLPHTYKVILSNADVRQLAKTQVTFSYRVERPGVTDPLPSKGQFVTFIGEPKHLAAPKAEDEQNGAIDPDLPHPRVRIPFDPIMQQGMAIDLIWAGTRPDTGSYTPELDWYFPTWEEIEAQQDFFIAVDGRHLKTLEGGTLELSYYLLREGPNGEVIRRESLHAALLQVGEPQLELVKPIVLGEQDGALEPGDLPGGIGKLTAPRPTVKPTQSGDIVTYTWTGEVTGTTEDSVTLNGLSKDKDVNFTLNATFVAEHIEPNRGKKVTVSYRIWRAATSETSYSNVLEFGVGQAIGQLLPPAVKEADGGTRLDPLNAQTHLTAVVNYDGMLVGDQISVKWTGADGTLPEGSHTTAPWPVTTLGPQEIPLEPKVVAFSLGKAITVNYKVTRGSSPMPSDTLTLSVLPLPENVLDKPLILQAADNGEGAEFDVSQLTANAVIQVNAWPFIALKQFVWLRVQGTNNDDSPYAQTFWQPPLSQTNETWITQGFYTHPIPFNELKNLKDGSELKVEFKAGLSGSQDENNALLFQVRTYTVKAVEDVKPAITRVTDSNGDEIAEGGRTVDTSITLTGRSKKGQRVDVLDGTVSKGQPTADPVTGIWTLLVTGLSVAAHSFTAKALYGSGQVSEARTLTVTTHPALIVNTDPVGLSAPNVSITGTSIPWTLTGADPIGTCERRSATGGVPPYTYTSTQHLIASVDNSGMIRSEGNGKATIVVSDAVGQTSEILVTCSNVASYIISPALVNLPAYESWRISQGALPVVDIRSDVIHRSILNIKYSYSFESNIEDSFIAGNYLGREEEAAVLSYRRPGQWHSSGPVFDDYLYGIAFLIRPAQP
ncbi:hypothetical protein [Pseudomonas sp. SW-3]|uniref:hypothetical protein n=1 Tax=Pseudomonas sp. SW-3 TaxID=147212 RepID=UPI00190C18A1|nr:hypothetical protein [Pseudomonas sp. SW-3]QQN96670.1 hypothetical protein JIO00_17250 [Pseudomonas sp. SW-3]